MVRQGMLFYRNIENRNDSAKFKSKNMEMPGKKQSGTFLEKLLLLEV